jgi:hypothetical protein
MRTLTDLPVDILAEISSYLPIRDVIALSWTCKYSKQISQSYIYECFYQNVENLLPMEIFSQGTTILYGSTILALIFENEEEFEADDINLLMTDMGGVLQILYDHGWVRVPNYGEDVVLTFGGTMTLRAREITDNSKVLFNGPSCCSNLFDGEMLFISSPTETLGLSNKGKVMRVNYRYWDHLFRLQDCYCHGLIRDYLDRGYLLKLEVEEEEEADSLGEGEEGEITIHELLFGFNF